MGGLYNNNAQKSKTPFEMRFSSKDRKESISVIQKPASSLKLTFFQVKDIDDLGSLEECEELFVPKSVSLNLYNA